MLSLFHTLLTIFSIALLFVAVGTLLWFLYAFFLKRIIRARRIANLRLNRMLDEMERRPRQQ